MSLFKHPGAAGRTALALAAGACLQAQEVTGNLSGQVTDEAGAGIPGVRILLRAPQLIRPRTLLTEAGGTFRAPLLPPGDYQITVTREGFLVPRATSVRVSVGTTQHQVIVLRPLQIASAEVEVVGSAATLDKSEAKTSTSLSSEFLSQLPTAGGDRSFGGAMDFAPGVAFNSGGGASIRGGLTQSTGYTLNGTSIRDDYQGDLDSTHLIDDAVEDAQVIQSALHARFGRTGGGMVNVVTRTGGNDFAGSIRTYLSRNSWRARRHREEGANPEGLADGYSNRRYELFFSGPLVKDRLWFAASSIQRDETVPDRILEGEIPEDWEAASVSGKQFGEDGGHLKTGKLYPYDLGRQVQSATTQDFLDAKLTLALSADHTVDFTFQQNTQDTTNHNPYGSPIVATVGSNSYPQAERQDTHSYGYRGILGPNLFLEARYSRAQAHTWFPAPPLEMVLLAYSSGGDSIYPYGFNLSPRMEGRDNQSGNLNIKSFLEGLGTHEVDFGFDFYEFIRTTNSQSGPDNRFLCAAAASAETFEGGMGPDPYGNKVAFQAVNYADAVALDPNEFKSSRTLFSNVPVMRQYYGRDGITKNRTLSLYVNDSWALNPHFNFMVGLRMDRFRVQDTDGTIRVDRRGPLAPRFLARFDPDGSGRHLLTLTGAKYVEEFGAGFTSAFIRTATSSFANFTWSAPTAWVDHAAITDPANYGMEGPGLKVPRYFFDAKENIILKDLSNPYVLEATLGYRRSHPDGSFFQANLVRKTWRNMFTFGQELDAAHVVTIHDPSGSPATMPGLATWVYNSDQLRRTYHAVELEFRHVLGTTWVLGGTVTWSRLTGNGNGGDNGSQPFFDPSLSPPAAFSRTLEYHGYATEDHAPSGPLLGNHTHKARFYLTATLPLGKGHISCSTLLRYDSGAGFGATQPVDLPPDPREPGMPRGASDRFTLWSTPRGAFSTNDLYRVDAKIDWALPLKPGSLQLVGYVQVDNLFNTMLQGSYQSAFQSGTFHTTTHPVHPKVNVVNPKTFGTDSGNYTNWNYGRTLLASIGLKF